MEKGKRKIAALLAAVSVVSVVGFGACEETPENGHVHEWGKYYLAKEATCTEDGILECVCSCGEKDYQTLTATGHTYGVDDICTKCGEAKETPIEPDGGGQNPDEGGNTPTTPEDETLGWSFEDIYDKYRALGYNDDYQTFKTAVKYIDGYITEMYVGSLGGLHLTVFQEDGKEIPLALPDERVEFEVEPSDLGTLERVYFKDANVAVVETDGTESIVGAFDELISVAVNKQNLLLFVFEGGKVAAVGKIATNAAPVVNANLIYRAVSGGYAVVGLVDKKTTSVEIPLTHRGLPVVEIENFAFYEATSLRSVKIDVNVCKIGYGAFRGCTALTSVIFKNTNGWNAGETEFESSILADTATAAKYLTETYVARLWSRL